MATGARERAKLRRSSSERLAREITAQFVCIPRRISVGTPDLIADGWFIPTDSSRAIWNCSVSFLHGRADWWHQSRRALWLVIARASLTRRCSCRYLWRRGLPKSNVCMRPSTCMAFRVSQDADQSMPKRRGASTCYIFLSEEKERIVPYILIWPSYSLFSVRDAEDKVRIRVFVSGNISSFQD